MQSKIERIFRPFIVQMWWFCAAFGALSLLSSPIAANADSPVFDLPIDCQLGSTCWLVNLVDRDPGPGRQDFRCGPVSYNTHRGTDIAIANKRIMNAGVAILAAAPGTVIGIRDGMGETTPAELKSRTSIRGRECGNGVTIRHDDDWTTQYCHMKAGSVRVKRGDKVRAGDRLGHVGLSGLTEFPHLHFVVRNGDTVIDPFTGDAQVAICDPASDVSGLWSSSAREALKYPGPQPFHSGFTVGKPDLKKLRAGQLIRRDFKPDTASMVFWSEVFTLKKGDVMNMTLRGPNDQVVSESSTTLDRPMARRYGFVGKKRPSGGWAKGIYTGHVEVIRDGKSATTKSTATVE